MRKILVAVVAGVALAACTADEGWKQPYGGCDEAWQAPPSQGAQECREHGLPE